MASPLGNTSRKAPFDLLPDWSKGQRIIYSIGKKEHFLEDGKVLSRAYSVEVERVDDQLMEIYFPEGILGEVNILYADGKKQRVSLIKNPLCIYYEVNPTFGLSKFPNLEPLHTYLTQCKAGINKATMQHSVLSEFLWITEILQKEVEDLEKYILEDIHFLHYCFGLSFHEGHYIDIGENYSYPRALARKLLPINEEEVDLLKFDLLSEKGYRYSFLQGHRGSKLEGRSLLESLKKEFLEGASFPLMPKGLNVIHRYFDFRTPSCLLSKFHYCRQRHEGGKWKRYSIKMIEQ